MDELDKALLLELSADCRSSFSSLADKYKVSVSTVKNRVNRMEEEGIISGYTVTPKLSLLNISTAIIILHSDTGPDSSLIETLGSHRLVEIVGIGLRNDGMVVVNYLDNRELGEFTDYIQTLESISKFDVYQVLLPPGAEGEQPTKSLNDMKKIDWALLEHLYQDGRMPLNELAKAVNASVPTVRKRMDFLREHHLCQFGILLNPVVVRSGFTLCFIVTLPSLTMARQIEIEEAIRGEMAERFWVSWKVVDRPVILLGFIASNPSEVQEIRQGLQRLIPDYLDIKDLIAGDAKYYPDIRKEIIKERFASYMKR